MPGRACSLPRWLGRNGARDGRRIQLKTGPYFQEAAAEFKKANPDIDVQIEVVPWDVLLQKLTTDISGGANADLSIIGTRWLVDFVQQGVAEPLDSYMNPEFKGRFIETFLTPSIMDGKTYGLPIAASARAMYYNKDSSRKPASPPAAELGRAQGRRRQDQGARRWRRRLRHAGQGDRDRRLFLLRHVVLRREHRGEGRHVRPRQKAAIDAATLYKGMIDQGLTQPGVTSNTREDVQNLFKQGKVGMMITAPFLSSQIKTEAPNLKYGVAPIPAGPGGDRGTYGVTDFVVMFQNSKTRKRPGNSSTSSSRPHGG